MACLALELPVPIARFESLLRRRSSRSTSQDPTCPRGTVCNRQATGDRDVLDRASTAARWPTSMVGQPEHRRRRARRRWRSSRATARRATRPGRRTGATSPTCRSSASAAPVERYSTQLRVIEADRRGNDGIVLASNGAESEPPWQQRYIVGAAVVAGRPAASSSSGRRPTAAAPACYSIDLPLTGRGIRDRLRRPARRRAAPTKPSSATAYRKWDCAPATSASTRATWGASWSSRPASSSSRSVTAPTTAPLRPGALGRQAAADPAPAGRRGATGCRRRSPAPASSSCRAGSATRAGACSEIDAATAPAAAIRRSPSRRPRTSWASRCRASRCRGRGRAHRLRDGCGRPACSCPSQGGQASPLAKGRAPVDYHPFAGGLPIGAQLGRSPFATPTPTPVPTATPQPALRADDAVGHGAARLDAADDAELIAYVGGRELRQRPHRQLGRVTMSFPRDGAPARCGETGAPIRFGIERDLLPTTVL